MRNREARIFEWYTMLPERDAREIVATVPGSVSYGAVLGYTSLPEDAKQRVRVAYGLATLAEKLTEGI